MCCSLGEGCMGSQRRKKVKKRNNIQSKTKSVKAGKMSKKDNKKNNKKREKRLLKKCIDFDRRIGEYFTKRATGLIFSAIILAFSVAGATTLGNMLMDISKIDSFVNEIALGESEDFFILNLGTPQFSSEKELKTYNFSNEEINVKEDIFITKYYIINSYFRDSHLCGFFVTLRDKRHKKYFGGPIFREFKGNEPLGEVSFGGPREDMFCKFGGDLFIERFGYCYIEETSKITCGVGNGYDVIQAYVDYGFTDIVPLSVEEASKNLPSLVDDNDWYSGPGGDYLVLLDRERSFPNTFGIVEGDLEEYIVRDMEYIVDEWDLSAYRIWWTDAEKGSALDEKLFDCNVTLNMD